MALLRYQFKTRPDRMSDEKPFSNDHGHFDFAPNDPDNPKNWSVGRKCFITGICISLVMNATFASSAPSGSFQGISKDLNVSIEAASLVTTVFLLGYVAGPFWWAPLSEFYGRRWIFFISFTSYLAFGFLCAFTPNFAALVIGRFLCGIFASSTLTNAPGVLADIWGPVQRGNAMILFAVMTFVGPALGPVVAGFLELKETWRWCFYTLLWMAGGTEILMFAIPETLAPIILREKTRRIRKKKLPGFEHVLAPIETTDRRLASMFRISLTRPWKLLFDPINFFVTIYYALVYTLLYMLFDIYPIVFQQKRGWNPGVGELPLFGVIIGECMGGILLYLVAILDKHKDDSSRERAPEHRLPAAMVGGVLFAITMFWFAWTAEFNSIHWIVPTLAGTFLSSSILLIFVALINYIVDCYLMYAASAIAGNTIVRSASAAAAPLFTNYMFDKLGVGGGGSVIGGLAVLLMPIPFFFYRYGERIRRRSRFTPTKEESKDLSSVEETA